MMVHEFFSKHSQNTRSEMLLCQALCCDRRRLVSHPLLSSYGELGPGKEGVVDVLEIRHSEERHVVLLMCQD